MNEERILKDEVSISEMIRNTEEQLKIFNKLVYIDDLSEEDLYLKRGTILKDIGQLSINKSNDIEMRLRESIINKGKEHLIEELMNNSPLDLSLESYGYKDKGIFYLRGALND